MVNMHQERAAGENQLLALQAGRRKRSRKEGGHAHFLATPLVIYLLQPGFAFKIPFIYNLISSDSVTSPKPYL